MAWFHRDVSARDCTGPSVLSPHHLPQDYDGASSNKRRLLLVSFSESETAFLCRTARILAASGNWECSFLLLHELAKDNPIVADLDAIGISHHSSSEGQFYDEYTYNEPMPVLGRSYARLLQWWREQKISRPYLRLAVPLIRAGLFIPWLFVRYIPWLLRYGIKITVRKVYQKAKEFLRSKHPKLYNGLKAHALAFQSFWFEIPWISEYNLRVGKTREESRLRGYIGAASRFFAARVPSILILAKDSAYYSTTTFVQAARNLGIYSVVIPYDRADSATLAKDRLGHPSHVLRSHAAREIAKKFPAWVYSHNAEALLLVAPSTVYAIEQLNLAPPNPWGYNNSRCDRIFLETEDDRQLFMQSGAPPDQLVVVGAPYMDNLDEMLCHRGRLRAQLCSSLGFDPDKPFVIASVPPNKVSQRTSDIEFQNYHSLLEKWSLALVKSLSCNLIYSLHPLTNPADVAFMEITGGKILQRPLEELLAAADLYVVDCSSTARWARYAGLDVIDYDVYRYNLWFNSAIEGVRHVTSYVQFLAELAAADERLQRERKQAFGFEFNRQLPIHSFGERLGQELRNLLNSNSQKVRDVV